MSWLVIVIIAYALNAVAMAIDKALLTKEVPRPAAYTFYISALGGLAIVLLPFDWQVPTVSALLFNFLAGATFTVGLFLLFSAIKQADVSRVAPFVGGINPFLIFVFAFLFLGERLGVYQVWGFFVVLLGTFLIAVELQPDKKKGLGQALVVALPAGIFFAISYTLTKYVFLHQSFISGFVWIRLGAFVAALFLLLSKSNRQAIFHTASSASGGSKFAFFTGQTSGALSAILVSYAISLASVSLVNALQGLQYVFLFAIVLVLKKHHPKLLAEDLSPRVYAQKVVSIALIVLGLFLISI
ncbi:DMT family transporter [Candidatus Falkowbacteria bacterium]|nr:DMT family transporter [Candidatus Falkowbacteria bacterium]